MRPLSVCLSVCHFRVYNLPIVAPSHPPTTWPKSVTTTPSIAESAYIEFIRYLQICCHSWKFLQSSMASVCYWCHLISSAEPNSPFVNLLIRICRIFPSLRSFFLDILSEGKHTNEIYSLKFQYSFSRFAFAWASAN